MAVNWNASFHRCDLWNGARRGAVKGVNMSDTKKEVARLRGQRREIEA